MSCEDCGKPARPRGMAASADRPTDAELRALIAYVEAGSVTGAAQQLGCAHGTVKGHLYSIRQKLKVRSSARAFYLAIRRGWVDPEQMDAA